jgi:hypothetical protein
MYDGNADNVSASNSFSTRLRILRPHLVVAPLCFGCAACDRTGIDCLCPRAQLSAKGIHLSQVLTCNTLWRLQPIAPLSVHPLPQMLHPKTKQHLRF